MIEEAEGENTTSSDPFLRRPYPAFWRLDHFKQQHSILSWGYQANNQAQSDPQG
jgi:hypothetical protein